NGHTVYVCLDSDTGKNWKVLKARGKLCRELLKRDCLVKVVTIPILEGVNGPDDYLAQHSDEDVGRLLDLAALATNSFEYGNGRFELNERGVWYQPGADKDGHAKKAVRIGDAVEVVALTRDTRSGEWGRLARWKDRDGKEHLWAIPCEMFQRDGGLDVRVELARQG